MLYEFLYNVETGWFIAITGWLLLSLIPLSVLYVKQSPTGESAFKRAYWMTYVLVAGLMLVSAHAREHMFDNDTGYPIGQYTYQSADVYDDMTKERYPIDEIPTYSSLLVWKAPDGTLAPYPLAKKIGKINARADDLFAVFWTFHLLTVIAVLIAMFHEETRVAAGVFVGSAIIHGVGRMIGGAIGNNLKILGGIGMAALFFLLLAIVLFSSIVIPACGVYVFCTTYGNDFVRWITGKKKYTGPVPPVLNEMADKQELAGNRLVAEAIPAKASPNIGCGLHGRSRHRSVL